MRWAIGGDPQFDYQVMRSNDDWPIHKLRTLVTGGLIAWMKPSTVCDPACGDASLLQAAHMLHPFQMAYLGDISRPNIENLRVAFPYRTNIADATDTLDSIPKVDLVVLTEFLEHVPDPDSILRLARSKAAMLVASSLLSEPADSDNAEHLWAWDAEGYQAMLKNTGWKIESVTILQLDGYIFQIYSAR